METSITTLHIALAFDQNYITPAYALLTSIFLNNSKTPIHFHAIATGLTAQEEADYTVFVTAHNSQISFYVIDEEQVKDFVLPAGYHFTLATYYRLFLPDLVPSHVKNLLYIDTDITVIKSLSGLYTMDLGHYPAAAAVDPQMLIRSDLGIYRKEDYFNAGVLLIHIAEWKAQQVSERAIQFLREYPDKIRFVDQDALNVVLMHNWFKLDNRFNLMQADVPYVPQKELKAFLEDKIIIHYTGKKPWQPECTNRLRYLYYEYLQQSPRAAEGRYLNYKPSLHNFKTLVTIKLLDVYFEYPILMQSWQRAKKILGK